MTSDDAKAYVAHTDSASTQLSAPFGPVGRRGDRGVDGRFTAGNKAALVVGVHSAEFWQAHQTALDDITREVMADAGFSPDDAPAALRVACDGLAQAVCVRDSAYQRLIEAGGPQTSSGRARRAYGIWLSASDRVEKHLRITGLRRVPRPAPTPLEYWAQRTTTPTDGQGNR
jgi:hypothetical protein